MANVNQVDGTFFQYNGNYFIVMLGQAIGIPNDNVTGPNLFGNAWNPGSFPTVSSLNVPEGPTFSSGACIVKGSSADPWYVFSWGTLMWIVSTTVVSTYSFNGPTTVPQSVINATPQAFAITQ